MFKWIIGGIVAALIGYSSYLAVYLGAFRPVVIEEVSQKTFILLGSEHIGPYHKIVPVIEKVETWAKQNQVDCTETFGLYLDNPKDLDEARLRSFGGCLLRSAAPTNLPKEFEVREFSAEKFIQAKFEGSPGIGPLKVYPKVTDFMTEKNLKSAGQVLEVYKVISQKEMTTTYFFATEK